MSSLTANMREWNKLKQSVYREDGSLRDVYVVNTDANSWLKWIEFINENYNLTWTAEEHNEEVPSKTIDASFIIKRWQSEMLTTCASIFLGSIQVNCFFFTDTEIENDIDPKEIKSLDDHNKVIDYMKAISKILGKKVILTEENSEEAIWIRVNCDNVLFL